MKKNILFISAVLLVLCIIPISTTQAIPRQKYAGGNRASALSAFNQKEPNGLAAEPGDPVFKNNVLTRDMQDPEGIKTAQSGKSTTTTSTGKNNPHVQRSGHGRSTMGDYVDNESAPGGGEEDQLPEDDSAVDYNRGLDDSSGYNEDL